MRLLRWGAGHCVGEAGTALTCTYVARAKNKDINTLQTCQTTESHVPLLCAFLTSPIVASTSPPVSAGRTDVRKQTHPPPPLPLRVAGLVREWRVCLMLTAQNQKVHCLDINYLVPLFPTGSHLRAFRV